LWIGTAGWSVPSRYAADVPAGGSQLERYARALNAVEINSSFYRPHQRKTYERWAGATPVGFRFSVKMPRTITHNARLANCSAMLDRFMAEVTGLGDCRRTGRLERACLLQMARLAANLLRRCGFVSTRV
jgi:uncharacterized protein YecE (DUF72 family)